MDNLKYLEMMKREENTWLDNRKNNIRENYEYRKIKALEIIAEELIRHNNYIEEYRTELKGADQIKIDLDNLECPKGFTKKVMKKIKKERR